MTKVDSNGGGGGGWRRGGGGEGGSVDLNAGGGGEGFSWFDMRLAGSVSLALVVG